MIRPRAIVTLRALGIGDFLTAVPAFRALERRFPDSRHLVAAPSPLSGLARLAGLDAEFLDTRRLAPAPMMLRNERGVLAVNLHGSGPESHRALFSSEPSTMIAFHNPEIGNPGPLWDDGEHEVERWCRLLEDAGIACDRADLAISAPNASPPFGTKGAVVIHPGAKDEARRWPLERWARVAGELAEGGQVVKITGAIGERRKALELARRAGLPPDAVLAGWTDLTSLAAIVAVAGLVISGDTGVAHLASALRTPSVVLFGPTSPAVWGPPPSGPHVVIWKGSTGDPHAETPDPGLLAIAPAEVIAAASARIGQPVG